MDYSIFIKQLDDLIDAHKVMHGKSLLNDLSDLPKADRQSLVTRVIATVHRVTGFHSTYAQEIERIIKRDPHLHVHTSSIVGIAKALREDIAAGYLKNLAELVHADIFSDFLEMATYLSDNNYKDAAAVLAGSTLESHLKKLATKNSIPVEVGGVAVKAGKLNDDLVKASVYNNLDHKNIMGWLDLRNKAAHGKYSEYSSEQVKLLISGVKDFIVRLPA